MTQRDVLLRWIEQVARVIERLLHGPGPVDLELARDQIEAAIAQHLGPLQAVLPRLDLPSAAGLLHDPDRIYGYAQLLALLSAVEQAANAPAAAGTRVRAIALAREALTRCSSPPEEWRRWVEAAERPGADPRG
jgi:hypothetical protein